MITCGWLKIRVRPQSKRKTKLDKLQNMHVRIGKLGKIRTKRLNIYVVVLQWNACTPIIVSVVQFYRLVKIKKISSIEN